MPNSSTEAGRSPRPARPRAAFLGTLGRLLGGAAAACLVAACSSTPKEPELTVEQKLGLYIENAFYYLELGDLDRAQSQAEKGLALDPDNQRFQLIYARVCVLRGNAASLEAALNYFDRRPEIPDYRWQLTYATALERKGTLYDEASRGVRDGTRPTPATDRNKRADQLAAEANEFWRRAHSRYQKSLELMSGQAETLNGLVRITALLGDFEASVAWSEELVATIRDSQALVRAQLDAPDLSAFREEKLREAARVNTELEVKARLHAATLLRRLDRKHEAIAQFDEILELQPELAAAYSLKAQLLEDLGELVKARAAIQRFLDLTDLPFDDRQVRLAFELQDRCERALRAQN